MTSILFQIRRKTTTLQVQESGTNATVKMTGNVTTLMESCRGHIQEGKGTKNPTHIQHKASRGFLSIFKKEG